MPPTIALKKILNYASQSVLDQIDRIKFKAFGADISERGFERALNGSLQQTLKTFKERDNHFLPQQSSMRDVQAGLSPEVCQNIVNGADRICDHRFDLLGSGETYPGQDINWHTDFKTGYQWDFRTYYKDIAIPYGKGDIKVPWELSRFQHLTVLGQAYWITGDERYALEFKNQISDWIKNNPVKLGPNWACTMDVAIRAANWLAAWEFFRQSRSIDDDFITDFFKSILAHGRFIRNNLEYYEELTANHYLSDIAGLFFIACMAPEFKESKEWLVFAQKELEVEMKKQVYPDGADFEASTCYHRLVLELFFYPARLGKRTGIEFSKEYNSRLKKMFEAILYLIKPNGKMPQIGDNDSGRFFRFEPPGGEVLDMRYILALGAVFFDEPDLKVYDSDDIRAAVLSVYGRDGLDRFKDMKKKGIEEIKSHAFPDAGWYIMRNNRDYLIISCGPNGQNGNGGHAHNDKLSFELCMDGEDILIDTGTCVYTPDPEMRNLFRSTAYHNTVVVNNMEQNNYDSGSYGLFILEDESKAKVILWEDNHTYNQFIGEHSGFDKHGFHHQRRVYFKKSEGLFEIFDRVAGEKPQSMACFHLKPEVKIENSDEGVYRVKNIMVKFKGFHKIDIVNSWYSREYGHKELSKCIRVYFKDKLETRIYPGTFN